MDAQKDIPQVNHPVETEDGPVYLVKTDVLKGIMWFSYDPHSMANMQPVETGRVREMLAANRAGNKVPSLVPKQKNNGEQNGFRSAAGEESITRFDKKPKNKRRKNNRRKNGKPDLQNP